MCYRQIPNGKEKLNQDRKKDVDEVPGQACQTNIDVDNIYVKSIYSRGYINILAITRWFIPLAFQPCTFALVLSAGEKH